MREQGVARGTDTHQNPPLVRNEDDAYGWRNVTIGDVKLSGKESHGRTCSAWPPPSSPDPPQSRILRGFAALMWGL